MPETIVGAEILNIITKSLYDNPMVVFREYVQNSVDSIYQTGNNEKNKIKIWFYENSLYFYDDGNGIDTSDFVRKMRYISISDKDRIKNIGYKGIGRLSGLPYCKTLSFYNISSRTTKNEVQSFSISREKYEELQKTDEYLAMSIDTLMDKICVSKSDSILSNDIPEKIKDDISKGFLVVLEEITNVLKDIIHDSGFKTELEWLLPLDFNKELYDSEQKDLYNDIFTENKETIKKCHIYYNSEELFRPISPDMMRQYVVKSNFQYAIGFYSFNANKITIDKKKFSGIRIYLDNMLLCTEEELLRNIYNFGLLHRTPNGILQTVRGIGCMIYITDKISITANARRTFIEVIDTESIQFLKIIAEFINNVYETRYALSNLSSAIENNEDKQSEKYISLRTKAQECLTKMASDNITLKEESNINFESLTSVEKKQMIKKAISSQMNIKIKEYLKSKNDLLLDNAWDDFVKWLWQENHK